MAATQSPLNNTVGNEDASRHNHEIKEIVQDFLKQSMGTSDGFRAAEAYPCGGGKLYNDISRKVVDSIQAAGDDPNFIEKITVAGCSFAEIIYAHTSLEHQYYIALYTVCFFYVDDFIDRHLEAVAQFSRRFATGEKQLNPALDVFVDLLRQSYELWPKVGADAIIAGTLEGVTAWYIEQITADDMTITPRATWWPNYFRPKTGFGAPYAHFIFMKNWRSTPGSYLQLLPYLEFFIGSGNDLLSFYKEELAGEKANYIHTRAATDEATVVSTARVLKDETLACMQKIGLLIGEDRELMALWRSFAQGYIAWHVKTPRYRLADLMLSQGD